VNDKCAGTHENKIVEFVAEDAVVAKVESGGGGDVVRAFDRSGDPSVTVLDAVRQI
jgi:hypothetical protein